MIYYIRSQVIVLKRLLEITITYVHNFIATNNAVIPKGQWAAFRFKMVLNIPLGKFLTFRWHYAARFRT